MAEINLLKQATRSYSFAARALKFIRVASIVSLSIVAFASISLFLFNFSSPLGKLQKEEQDLTTTIGTYKDRFSSLLFVSDRLRSISNILSKRTHYESQMQQLVSSVPPDVTIDNLQMDSQKIVLSSSSASLFSLDTFLDSISQMTSSDQKTYKHLILSNFGFDIKRNIYQMSVEIDMI